MTENVPFWGEARWRRETDLHDLTWRQRRFWSTMETLGAHMHRATVQELIPYSAGPPATPVVVRVNETDRGLVFTVFDLKKDEELFREFVWGYSVNLEPDENGDEVVTLCQLGFPYCVLEVRTPVEKGMSLTVYGLLFNLNAGTNGGRILVTKLWERLSKPESDTKWKVCTGPVAVYVQCTRFGVFHNPIRVVGLGVMTENFDALFRLSGNVPNASTVTTEIAPLELRNAMMYIPISSTSRLCCRVQGERATIRDLKTPGERAITLDLGAMYGANFARVARTSPTSCLMLENRHIAFSCRWRPWQEDLVLNFVVSIRRLLATNPLSNPSIANERNVVVNSVAYHMVETNFLGLVSVSRDGKMLLVGRCPTSSVTTLAIAFPNDAVFDVGRLLTLAGLWHDRDHLHMAMELHDTLFVPRVGGGVISVTLSRTKSVFLAPYDASGCSVVHDQGLDVIPLREIMMGCDSPVTFMDLLLAFNLPQNPEEDQVAETTSQDSEIGVVQPNAGPCPGFVGGTPLDGDDWSCASEGSLDAESSQTSPGGRKSHAATQVLAAMTPTKKCVYCEQGVPVVGCARCGQKLYCSDDCQLLDWARHAEACLRTGASPLR